MSGNGIYYSFAAPFQFDLVHKPHIPVRFQGNCFGSVGIKLARAAKVDVIPFALKTNFLKNGKIFRDLGPVCPENHVHFEFGEPIKIEGNGKEANQQVIDFISSRLEKWNREA